MGNIIGINIVHPPVPPHPPSNEAVNITWSSDGKISKVSKILQVPKLTIPPSINETEPYPIVTTYYYDGMGNKVMTITEGDLPTALDRCDNSPEMMAEYQNCFECVAELGLKTTYYGREAGGKVLAVYNTEGEMNDSEGFFTCNDYYKFIWLDDWYIYGSEADGRIATVDPREEITSSGDRLVGSEFPMALNDIISPPDSIEIPSAMWKSNIDGISAKYQTQQRIPDFRRYEVKDHLGNVRTVIADYKNPFTTSGPVSNWTYLADIKNISNTYPYGKSYGTNAIYNADDDYRFGFNGMEKEKNISSSGNTFDFGAGVYDSEFPTFLSRDPLEAEFPYQSSYVFAGNTPIQAIDENGTRKRVDHLFNVEFDKGEYTITQLPNYERQDGKSPKNSYGTDEMQYHFNGNFYDDIYKVPGYQFAFDQKVGPIRKTIGSIVDITVGVLLAIATKGEAKAGNLFSRYLFSNAMYQISVSTIEMIENDRDKFPTNLGGVVGLTLDFTVGNETKSIQGYLELGDEMLMWRPRKIPDESLDKINYGISLYNVFDKSTADEFLKQMKSDLYNNNYNKSNSSNGNSNSNKNPTGSQKKGKKSK